MSDLFDYTLVPVTIKIIVECELNPSDDGFKLNGYNVTRVVLCAVVTSLENKASFTEYTLTDDTGTIQAVKMNDVGTNVDIDTRVKISGTIRVIDNVKKIVVHNIRKVTHPSEYACHQLDVEYNRLKSVPIVTSVLYNMDTDARRVHDVIADDMSDSGPDIQDICLVTKLPFPKVRGILELLTSEGFVYSTIDETHFRSTGALV